MLRARVYKVLIGQPRRPAVSPFDYRGFAIHLHPRRSCPRWRNRQRYCAIFEWMICRGAVAEESPTWGHYAGHVDCRSGAGQTPKGEVVGNPELNFDSLTPLPNVNCPLLILHAEDDHRTVSPRCNDCTTSRGRYSRGSEESDQPPFTRFPAVTATGTIRSPGAGSCPR
ncbi:hypothetical protein TYRP_022272, partial [Tyrophagus putrescentiae]